MQIDIPEAEPLFLLAVRCFNVFQVFINININVIQSSSALDLHFNVLPNLSVTSSLEGRLAGLGLVR